jgi:hypothetical protein
MTMLMASVNTVQAAGDAQEAAALKKIDEALESIGDSKTTQSSVESPNNWTPRDTMAMSGAVLGYSLVVLLAATVVARSIKTPELAIRLFTSVLIINSAVFFIVAGYSSQQIAPAFGLLGTMAGYVLGKSQTTSKEQDNTKE